MSSNPNDPFQNSSAATAQPQAAPPKKSRRGCLVGCFVVSGLVLLVCCGGGYWAMTFVTGQMGKEVQRRLAGNPVIEEHIGELESVDFDLMETSRQTQQAQEEGKPGVLVFRIQGSKGSAQLLVDQDESNQPNFESPTLLMPDGTRHTIDVAADTSLDELEIDDLEMDMGDLIDSGEIEVEVESDPPASDAPDTPDLTEEALEEEP